MRPVKARSRHRHLDLWEKSELRAVAAVLQSIESRLQSIAARLAAESTTGDRRRALARLETTLHQLWGLAGETLGAKVRLAWIAEGLRQEPRTAETADDDHLDESAELLSTIQCILADSLAPAIRSLKRAASGSEDR